MRKLIVTASVILVGCSSNIHIISVVKTSVGPADKRNIEVVASGPVLQKWEKFTLELKKRELLYALRAESTVHVDIMDCSARSNHFPSIAFLGNIALDEQHQLATTVLAKSPDVITIDGYAPLAFVQELRSICVRLSGGSYGGLSLQSNLMKVP